MDTSATPDGTIQRSLPLIDRGYCLYPQILDRAMLHELRRVTDELLALQTEDERRRFRYQGSNINIAFQHPVFGRLFSWPPALAVLAELGYSRPKWGSAFLLSKPPHAPPLYWHQDWAAWGDPVSAAPEPAQLFLMYYLADTSPENGCLRVIPGSHRRRLAFHDQLPEAHEDATYFADPDSPIFQRHPDEVDVPVKAGDLVIGDARVLHAAHANRSDQRRTLLTLWYYPAFEELPEPIQARFGRREPVPPEAWGDPDVAARMEPLIACYLGSAAPAAWKRTPEGHLPG